MNEDERINLEAEAADLEPDAPPGYHYEWVESEGWRLATPEERETRRCRWGAGPHRMACGVPAVAATNRLMRTKHGWVDSWWFYCGEHLYGRRIRDGRVEHRRLVDEDDS